MRGDTFVVETNIHYPTESSVDRRRAAEDPAVGGGVGGGATVREGWRQHEHWLKKVRKLVRKIGRASRAKGQGADRLKPGYQKLLELAKDLLGRVAATAAWRWRFRWTRPCLPRTS